MSAFGALTNNWKLKLLALALAVLLWVVVSAEAVTSNWITLPMEVRATDPDYRLKPGSVPSEVQVRFTGSGRDLLDVAVRRPPLMLAVDRVEDTVAVLDLEPGMVQVPNQLAVNAQDVRPSRVMLEFTRLESRTVPVRLRVGRGLGSEWTLVDSLRLQPSRVRISGPESRVESIESIPTLPVDLAAEDSAFSLVVPLDTGGLRGLRVSASRVRVVGEVDRIGQRLLEDVGISLGPGVETRPRRVDVQLQGPQRTLRGLDPQTLRVVVAIDSIPTRIPPEGTPVPLRVEQLPAGVRAQLAPARVQLLPARLPGEPVEGGAAADSASERRGPAGE